MHKIVSTVYALVDTISTYEQRLANEDDYIERINKEIEILCRNDGKLQTTKLLKIERLKVDREKAKKNVNRLVIKRNDLYSCLDALVPSVIACDAKEDLLNVLYAGKAPFEEKVESLSSHPDINKNKELKASLRSYQTARDTYDVAIGALNGVPACLEMTPSNTRDKQ